MARLTIIGTGYIGTSIGLALKARKANLEIVGHDKDFGRAGEAKKLGAVDRAEWNLPAALEGAGLVVVATPLAELEAAFQQIAAFLPPGCVVTDTAALKGPVFEWASRHLGDRTNFVGGHPIIAEAGEDRKPSPTIFEDRSYCIISSESARSEAVDQVIRLAQALGARPLFLDATEHDSQMAVLEQLPALLASTLMNLATANPAWRDGQRLAGAAFGNATSLARGTAAEQRAQLLANREVVLGWLRALQGELGELTRMLEVGEAQELLQVLEAADKERTIWHPGLGPQPELPTPELPRARDQFASWFLPGRRDGKKRE